MTDKHFEDRIQIEGVNFDGYGYIPKAIMTDSRLTIESKAIYSYFASYTGSGNSAFPGLKKILKDLDISKNRFYKHRQFLLDLGYISVQPIYSDKKEIIRNIYTLHTNPVPISEQKKGINSVKKNNENSDNRVWFKTDHTYGSKQTIPMVQNEEGNNNNITITNKKEEDIYTPSANKSSDSLIYNLMIDYPEMKPVINYLQSCELNANDVYNITVSLVNEPNLINQQAIIEQMQWATMKAKYEGVYDFVKYFLEGLRKKIETRSYSTHTDAEELFSEQNDTYSERPKIPLFNWLEN